MSQPNARSGATAAASNTSSSVRPCSVTSSTTSLGIDLVRDELRTQPLGEVFPVEQGLRQEVQKQPPFELEGAKAPHGGLETAALERNAQAGDGRGGYQGARHLERPFGTPRESLMADGFAGGPIDDGLKKRI